MPFSSFYEGKKVLLTGITGFKGSWLAVWLEMLGAEVHGIGLEPDTSPSLFDLLGPRELAPVEILDIRDADRLRDYVRELRPDVVLHLAAQALVRRSYDIPLETLETNFMGTANLLDAVGRLGDLAESPCPVVVVTSDKCYENRETFQAYREDDPVGGHDIYSMSKGAVELLVASWRRAFFTPADGSEPSIPLASCRAGNVIGGGDWAADRIVPDSIRSLSRGESIAVRNPGSVRPWQHVLEPLSGYLQVGAMLGRHSAEQGAMLRGAWNFGPGRASEKTVGELCDAIVQRWGAGAWSASEPGRAAAHEAGLLNLAIDKAWNCLGWQPVWGFDRTIDQTVSWYRANHESGHDKTTMLGETRKQIQEYMQDARAMGLRWTETG